eukprot:1780396-Rhodomonas_salina.1
MSVHQKRRVATLVHQRGNHPSSVHQVRIVNAPVLITEGVVGILQTATIAQCHLRKATKVISVSSQMTRMAGCHLMAVTVTSATVFRAVILFQVKALTSHRTVWAIQKKKKKKRYNTFKTTLDTSTTNTYSESIDLC